MTLGELKQNSRAKLVEIARRERVDGWHDMRKDELAQAIALVLRAKRRRAARTAPSQVRETTHRKRGATARANGRHRHVTPPTLAVAHRKLPKPKTNGHNGEAQAAYVKPRLIASEPVEAQTPVRDTLVAHGFDANWIRVQWTLSAETLRRAEAALGLERHCSVAVIRVFDAEQDETASPGDAFVRDVEVQTSVDNWFVPIDRPTHAYRVQLGFRTPSGRFYPLVRSNRVRTPVRANGAAKLLAMHAGHTNGHKSNGHAAKKNGATNGHSKPDENGHAAHGKLSRIPSADFRFGMEAEMVLRGATHPGAELSIMDEPVKLNADGSFVLRLALPNGRQVIPAVAIHAGCNERRTIVISIERNTKELEPHPADEAML